MAESTLLLDRLEVITKDFHAQGLYLFTWGEANNKWENYAAQKSYGLDGIILDDVARVTKVNSLLGRTSPHRLPSPGGLKNCHNCQPWPAETQDYVPQVVFEE